MAAAGRLTRRGRLRVVDAARPGADLPPDRHPGTSTILALLAVVALTLALILAVVERAGPPVGSGP